jgi:hypothetical protein
MLATTRNTARLQAQANAIAFNLSYSYGTDTGGNWRVERTINAPDSWEETGIPCPTCGQLPPDAQESE